MHKINIGKKDLAKYFLITIQYVNPNGDYCITFNKVKNFLDRFPYK